jgi:hypothetical protein
VTDRAGPASVAEHTVMESDPCRERPTRPHAEPRYALLAIGRSTVLGPTLGSGGRVDGRQEMVLAGLVSAT